MRRDIRGSRALITGASSGIGRELALEMGRRGARLVITGRRAERLDEVVQHVADAGSEAVSLPGEITDAELRSKLLRAASERFGGLDLLINNAGTGGTGLFADSTPERLREIMEVNFFAPVELIRAALPLLGQGRRPMIVNVGSVLGHRAVPTKSEYCASKFALHGISDALGCELRGAGIDVLLVSPSTTQSEFFSRQDAPPPFDQRKRRGMPADRVARQIVRGIERGRHEIILSAGGKSLVWLDRLFPRLADYLVARFG